MKEEVNKFVKDLKKREYYLNPKMYTKVPISDSKEYMPHVAGLSL
jgi:hypothetical protein